MFDLDAFLGRCREARDDPEPLRAIREVLDEALTDPVSVGDTLRPGAAGLSLLLNEPDLTVIHVVWPARMQLFPHDHRMWAAIGIYAGAEDNEFFRRAGDGAGRLTESGGKRLRTGDVLLLGDDVIHAVTNPLDRVTGAIHVYGGDFVREPRSQWGPGPREERPFDMESVLQQFADAAAASTDRTGT